MKKVWRHFVSSGSIEYGKVLALSLLAMPRKALIRSSCFPYHVVARSNNRLWFAADRADLWAIFTRLLSKVSDAYGARIHSFVLMSNHFHLVLTTPMGNIDRVMQYFMREATKSINRTSGSINHQFGGPYKWSLIRDSSQYLHVLKYVFRNPVKAGMCSRVEAYPWSTLLEYLQENGELSQLSKPSMFDGGCGAKVTQPADFLSWVSIPYSAEEDDSMRRALRRKLFEWKPDRQSRKIPPLFTK